jgi:hypothetical protein
MRPQTIVMMDIKYLTILMQYPTYTNSQTGFTKKLVGLSESQISSLQQQYNNNNLFPLALMELLTLAGGYCYVLDYGPKGLIDLQQAAKRFLTDNNLVISRPFFAIDEYGGDQFLFIYLDINADDPIVYQVTSYVSSGNEWLFSSTATLTN